VQAGSVPNPHFAIGRFTEGSKVEIERMLRFDVLGLITLPWRNQWAGQQAELARLQAAQDVVRIAADTRRAWIRSVAAQQSAAYLRDVKEATEAGAELARRMARVGNWSKLRQAQEQAMLADATVQLARAQQAALASREQLTRLLGLWGTQINFQLPERLPDLPKTLADMNDVEARALRERLDVRTATLESGYVAGSLGMVKATGFVNALEVSYGRNTTFDNATGERETKRGFELELPLPIFDWGQAKNARAEGVYMQSVAKVRGVAVQARSEAREAYHGWRTAYDVAKHYRDEIVPLRRFINEEIVLRYNGMLASVWDLLSDARQNITAVNASMEAQRDFWLADTDLHDMQPDRTSTHPGHTQSTTQHKANRRNFFSGAATAVAAASVSRVAMAALPEPAMQTSADTAAAAAPTHGPPLQPRGHPQRLDRPLAHEQRREGVPPGGRARGARGGARLHGQHVGLQRPKPRAHHRSGRGRPRAHLRHQPPARAHHHPLARPAPAQRHGRRGRAQPARDSGWQNLCL
jgi:multidrug efflux system outer membrane protein